jgi:hypothetical protein
VAEVFTFIMPEGGGANKPIVVEPSFTYFGFRYIQISGTALAPSAERVMSKSKHERPINATGTHNEAPALPVSVVAHFIHTVPCSSISAALSP